MELAFAHPWDLPVKDAEALQYSLAAKVLARTTFPPESVRSVAGVDVSFREDRARAAVVVLSFPGLEPLAQSVAERPIQFPYVPGLLAFREGPAVLAALAELAVWPDLLVFDAHGLAHKRRCGLASHLGIVLDTPSIGCAKSRLIGEHEAPGDAPGDWRPLLDGGETIGAVLRTRPGVRPVYVSVGHRVDLPTAIELVMRCTRGRRLPEPTRLAHNVAGGARLTIQSGHPGWEALHES